MIFKTKGRANANIKIWGDNNSIIASFKPIVSEETGNWIGGTFETNDKKIISQLVNNEYTYTEKKEGTHNEYKKLPLFTYNEEEAKEILKPVKKQTTKQ